MQGKQQPVTKDVRPVFLLLQHWIPSNVVTVLVPKSAPTVVPMVRQQDLLALGRRRPYRATGFEATLLQFLLNTSTNRNVNIITINYQHLRPDMLKEQSIVLLTAASAYSSEPSNAQGNLIAVIIPKNNAT